MDLQELAIKGNDSLGRSSTNLGIATFSCPEEPGEELFALR